ncbi:FAD:protein FMN transferase [Massilia sp. S19_KUP03_FR1]|uniref:FAD:protein FMN transferase n=1 Tax=Massilia sp. S19_KUP03_FR1 TaxID=3025503 RepID=UPI002FCDB6E0
MQNVLVPIDIDPTPPRFGSVVREVAGLSMGTSWSVKAVVDAPWPDLQAELDQVVAQMSHWEAGSDLGRFNRAPAGTWQTLPAEFATVIAYALDVSRDSGGAYDPCAGALVNLWGFGPERRFDEAHFYAPSPAAIDAVMQAKHAVQYDAATRRLFQPGGVQLDLSSVAKGFAVDQLARCLRMQGVQHYLVEVGGELRGAGVKPDGQPWWVALEGVPDAHDADTASATIAALHGLALATSGDYRRYFSYGTQRASHTLDPRTGYPITNDVASVTVLHPSCMAADALSTVLTVLGAVDGLAFAEQRGLAARFLVRRPGALAEITTSAYRALLR